METLILVAAIWLILCAVLLVLSEAFGDIRDLFMWIVAFIAAVIAMALIYNASTIGVAMTQYYETITPIETKEAK